MSIQRASFVYTNLSRALGDLNRKSIERGGTPFYYKRFHTVRNARTNESANQIGKIDSANLNAANTSAPPALARPNRYVRKFLLGTTLASAVGSFAYYQLALNTKEQRRTRVQMQSFFRAFR